MGTAHPLKRPRGALACLLLGLLLPLAAAGHPYHTAFAEVGWSESGEALEVSLRVLPEDLETALTWQAGEAVVLRDEPAVRARVAAYLQQHFRVFAGEGPALPLRLVGMEIAYDETWLYFTVSASPEQRLSLRNTLLMEVDGSQTNRVHPLWAGPDAALVLTRAQPEAVLWRGH